MPVPARENLTASAKTENLFSSPEKRNLVLCLLLAVATLVLYNPVTHYDFINFDDDHYVFDNPHVRAGLSWGTVAWAFRSTQEANWHPLTWLAHALDCELFRLNPAGHHYMSVLLHVVNVLLLFLLLERATGFRWRSLMVAALFAVHPINVESIAWVAERKNLLCTFFFLLAVGAYGWYARKPGLGRYLLVAGLFVFGLMSKPMVITFPFALLLLDYWPLGRMNCAGEASASGSQAGRNSLAWLVVEKVPLMVLSVASAIVTLAAQKAGGAVRSAAEYPLPARLENAIVAYAVYVGKALWPARLAAMYPHRGSALPVWAVIAAAIFVVGVTAAVLVLRQHRYLAVGWFWYLGIMVPVIGLVQVGGQAMADRYAYIPFLGLFVMMVWGIGEWAGARQGSATYLATAGVVVIAALSAATHYQESYWHDSVTLWEHALRVTEGNFVAEDNLGAALVTEGKSEEAIAHFRSAARIRPDDPVSQLNIGVYEKAHGRVKEAIEHYQNVLRLTHDRQMQAHALNNLGSAYRTLGDYARARENYEVANRLAPDAMLPLIGLGLVAQKTGDFNQAAGYYSQAVNAQATDVGYLLLSQALEKSGRRQEAEAALEQAQRLPGNPKRAQEMVDQLLAE